MKYVTLVLGIFLLSVITYCNFTDTNLFDKREEIVLKENEYYLDRDFEFVQNYDDEVHNYTELLNYIYHVVNTGSKEGTGYCVREYKNCAKDLEEIGNNKELLSTINNFVHPYNSFSSIIFTYNTKGEFDIKVNKIYSEENIVKINEVVDRVIKENIVDTMTTTQKLKIIHDYIIDNTKYDTLKSKNINDMTYKSNTAIGVLLEGYGICSGYSDAMGIFLDKLGIDNYKISNDTHIWNLVKVNNKWLHIDLTWDDPIYKQNLNRDTYFLITTAELEKLNDNTHSFNKTVFKEAV